MYAVGMLGSYLSQGVYAVAGPFQPFGGAVDIIVVQQEDGDFKSSPWYVKFGDFQGVLKRQEKIVDISVNDAPADFHMILDSTGEAYFEKDVEPDEGTSSVLPDGSPSLSRQEGDIEIVVSADGGDIQSHEDEGSGSTASYNSLDSSIVGIAEVKIVTREEPRETDRQEQGDKATSDGSHMEREHDKETNQVISETRSLEITDSIKDNCALDAPCLVNLCNLKSAEKSQEMGWDANIQVNVLHNGHLQSTDDEADFNNDAVPDTDLLLTDTARTVNIFSDLEEVLPSRAPVILDRVNEDSLMGDEENMTNNTAVFSMAESKLQNVLTFLHAEAAAQHTSCSEPRVDDDPSKTETSEFLANLGGNDHCNNVSNIDIGLDEDGMLTGIELFTAGEQREKSIYYSNNGMKFDVPNDFREDMDPLSWDLASSIKQGLDDDVFLHSQSNSPLTEDNLCDADGESGPLEKEKIVDSNILGDTGSTATLASVSSPFTWRIWHLLLRWSRIEKTSPLSNQNLLAAASVAMKPPFTEGPLEKHGLLKWQQKTKLRTYVPTSTQLASLNLENGPNKVTFTFSSVIGKTQVDARIYLWKWNTKIVVSDVDGTITKSDVLGQVMPLVGRDWSQYGVTRLFSAIKDNGYEVLFLSARAISQACLTRRFLLNLKQDGETLPEGPVFISPDGLIPSLYREVIRRAPHEFKISCLEGIREVFPKNVNPFYAGFGNRDTDKISYLKVGIPEGKIFIINPKGEVMVNHRVEFKSYTSLYALVDKMFPPMFSHEQEEYNEWNFWKMALPDIDDELNTTSSRIVKSVGSTKK